MTNLILHIDPVSREIIGSLSISAKAVDEMGRLLRGQGHPDFAPVEKFGPVVATGVASFLTSDYFTNSKWFRAQSVHRTILINIEGNPPLIPIFHLKKGKTKGYQVITQDEAELAEGYYEQRLIEETKVEIGIEAN